MGGIRVERGTTDRESMKACIDALTRGEPVVVFPEGRRRSGPIVEDLFDGAAYMAAKAGVPIVPVGIGGSERAMSSHHKLPRPKKIHVIIGPPLPPPQGNSRRAQHQTTEQLKKELQRLFDLAQARIA